MIERLELKNFTVFKDLTLDFSPKINVIIGENGTGKTHLLKAAYSLCAGAPMFKSKHDTSEKEIEEMLTAKLCRLFMPLDDKFGKMHRQGATDKAYLSARFVQGQEIAATFFNNSKKLAIQDRVNFEQYQAEAIFIPTKEVLSLVKGMTDENHDQNTVDLIFDDGYVDLANALMKSPHEDIEAKINLDPRLNTIIPQLVNLIGGRYQWDNGGFCFQEGKYVEKPSPKRTQAKAAQIYQDSIVTEFMATTGHLYSSSMTAEGFRKIGILHRLLSNGTVFPGLSGPLFWDEPESNMNPKLMERIVRILLELARNGQQIILATHDYVLLKWFDLLMDKGKDDHVLFHSLYCDPETSEIKVAFTEDYQEITPNPIDEAFGFLINQEIENDMGGLGK
ncbi:AAA family ATPase [Desulfobacter hydrogenophilus]|uniref:AAA family ATPase n=1 Tax=Desulfobacter hydrogenophilus TaxID=2291 RepID=A0A328F9T1_9BACT|nr:ATP-binding protein [Desulfobacter hydrogenophilus]NDY73874.1 AAA family ATPase [Desulfobacter hydrogenophilus]QBH14731.1 AAA family ATPase [Desulfobacter hydrogenophilus]RAM00430.1 AAA family ATPase [Desulfobacter hydrogenophilus]